MSALTVRGGAAPARPGGAAARGEKVGLALRAIERDLLEPIRRPDWLEAGTPPDAGALAAYQAALQAALDAPVDQVLTRRMIGLLAAAYPHGTPADQSAWLETLNHDAAALGYGPAVLAGACQSIRRTLRFLPSVAELVEACEAARYRIRSSLALARQLEKRLAEAAEAAKRPPRGNDEDAAERALIAQGLCDLSRQLGSRRQHCQARSADGGPPQGP